jgi:hypothetical protein
MSKKRLTIRFFAFSLSENTVFRGKMKNDRKFGCLIKFVLLFLNIFSFFFFNFSICQSVFGSLFTLANNGLGYARLNEEQRRAMWERAVLRPTRIAAVARSYRGDSS